MTDPKTTILPLDDVLHRLDCFINQDNVGTIFPENFFTSIRYYLSPLSSDIQHGWNAALENGGIKNE